MKITDMKLGETTLLVIEGRIDSNTATDAEQTVISHIEDGAQKLVADFQGLDYISSAGLRVFLLAAKKLKKVGGSIAISGMKPHIREVFDMAGFTALFDVFDTKEDAVKSYN